MSHKKQMKTLHMKNGSSINFEDSEGEDFVGSEHSIMFEVEGTKEDETNISDYQEYKH